MFDLLEGGKKSGTFEATVFSDGRHCVLAVLLVCHAAFEFLHSVKVDEVEESLFLMLVENL